MFYLLPAQALIDDLDALFDGRYQPTPASTSSGTKRSGNDAPSGQGQLDLW